MFYALDSGLRSRLYDFDIANIQQIEGPTMQIAEVARCACLPVDAIRFHERRRLLPKAARTSGKFRLSADHGAGENRALV